jgi:hypothetical protein
MSPHNPVRAFIPQSAGTVITDTLLPEKLLFTLVLFALVSVLTRKNQMALFEES